jgi:rare lipoprotein A
MNALTAAHPTLPMPSYVRVTNLQNGRSLVLRVNDRGPYARDRVIDLSRRSAQALGFARMGTARVRVQYLGRAPLNGDDSLERRVYASQSWTQHASLEARPKRNSRTQLAQAVQKEIAADPMVVGSLPGEDAKPFTPGWNTRTGPVSRQTGQKHFVQAASFTNRRFAESLRLRLANLGNATMSTAQVGGKTFYRVRLGPYGVRHDADEALRAVVNSGVTDARIVLN